MRPFDIVPGEALAEGSHTTKNQGHLLCEQVALICYLAVGVAGRPFASQAAAAA
jgi:hypothetical protein